MPDAVQPDADPTDAFAAPPRLVFIGEVHAEVAAPVDVGQVGAGRRRMVPITGGRFAGPGLRGRILPGGADWQIVRVDGVTELDSRYVIEMDTGAVVTVHNTGIRSAASAVMARLLAGEPVDPALVYFRTTPIFETAAPALQWLTQAIFIGVGERYPAEVVIRFYRVE